MQRRLMIATILLATPLAWADRPNLVLAFADDLGRYASAYRDPDRPGLNDLIDTPNFDRVAREGALFDCALVSAPSCTPSRAAVLSGRNFFRNGSHAQLHHPWWDDEATDPWDGVRGFPLTLQGTGYHIGWTYKLHVDVDRMGGADHNYQSAGRRFNQFSQNASRADDPEAEKLALLDEVRQNFRSFLADREGEQPFFYWFNPTNTHRGWERGSGKKLWGLDPDELRGRLPAFLTDDPVVREDFADYLGEALAFDAAVGVLLAELEERGELDNTLLVVSGDHGAPGFPRGKTNLYDFGTQVPLAIRWPARIASGKRIGAPVSLVDLAPTFLAAADVGSEDQPDGENLLPYLRPDRPEPESAMRGWALVGRENHVQGSRAGAKPYPMRAIRTGEYLYIRNFAPDRWPVTEPPLAGVWETNGEGRRKLTPRHNDLDGGPTRTFYESKEGDPSIAGEWRLFFDRRPAEELYYVPDDPDQMRNVAEDPRYASALADLRQRLDSELNRDVDPRVVGDGTAFDRPPYAPVPGVIDEHGRVPRRKRR
ncbi:Choline-sulfatase [Planctomycetes bacterium MalM25]|nr:Choline-sulfatase [Planctomycetes bacterium MalM25]